MTGVCECVFGTACCHTCGSELLVCFSFAVSVLNSSDVWHDNTQQLNLRGLSHLYNMLNHGVSQASERLLHCLCCTVSAAPSPLHVAVHVMQRWCCVWAPWALLKCNHQHCSNDSWQRPLCDVTTTTLSGHFIRYTSTIQCHLTQQPGHEFDFNL